MFVVADADRIVAALFLIPLIRSWAFSLTMPCTAHNTAYQPTIDAFAAEFY